MYVALTHADLTNEGANVDHKIEVEVAVPRGTVRNDGLWQEEVLTFGRGSVQGQR